MVGWLNDSVVPEVVMRSVLVVLFLALVARAADAGKLAGVVMPDATQVEGTPLVLNGMGIRKATIFNIKVYVAGLYLEHKSRSAEEIIRSEQVKRLDVVLLRDADRDDIIDAWRTGLKRNGADMAKIKIRFDRFSGWISDLKEGDSITLFYVPGRGVTLIVGGQRKGTIGGADFASAMFAIWLGRAPADEDLKDSLLGR